MSRPLVVAVLGSTATGKSALALALAERFGGEIINCDSTAVYRGFDIGTDKVSVADRRGIPHHLIDVADPTEEYTAARYARESAAAIRDIHARGRLPILAGGTCFRVRDGAHHCGNVSKTSPRSAVCRFCTGCWPAWIRVRPAEFSRTI